jgi:hypothetical protein
MTRSRDARRLVLGAAVGYDRNQVRVFVESLREVGYAGDVVLLVGVADFSLKRYLRSRGVRTIATMSFRRIHGPIHSHRFPLFAKFVEEHAEHYDQIMISDVRDVAFQGNPFEGAVGAGCQFYLEAAPHTIGADPHVGRFTRTFLTPEQAEAVAQRRIICCGVTIASTSAMLSYLKRVNALISAIRAHKRRRIGADTAFHILLAYLDPACDSDIVENNIHVATMGLEPAARYQLSHQILVGNFAPPILHQYDRHSEIAFALENRYRAIDREN